jgi:hypothetical protein
MIGEAIHALLSGDAGVSAIAGSRIYPLMIPQHVYGDATKQPCIVYQRVGVARQPLFCGTDRTVNAAVQIDTYARSYERTLTLATAVRDALMDYSGAVSIATSPVSSIAIKKILLDSEFDLLDIEPGLYRVSMTYSVWHVS